MLSERDLSAFLHTRACAMVMLGVACVLAWVAYAKGGVVPLGGPLGIGLTPARE